VAVINAVRIVHAHITVQNVMMKIHVPENKNVKTAYALTHQNHPTVKRMVIVLLYNVVKVANVKIVTQNRLTMWEVRVALVELVLVLKVIIWTEKVVMRVVAYILVMVLHVLPIVHMKMTVRV